MRSGWAAAMSVLLLAGCASLLQPAEPTPEKDEAAPSVPTSLEVVAPAPLDAMLERYLDLARVGGLAGGAAIDETEWSRLIAAAPAQARELLQTEGYFSPTVTLTRESEAGAEQRRVRLQLDPGPRALVAKVTLEVEGALAGAAQAGDEQARATLADLHLTWKMPPGTPFRNPAWRDAKTAALTRLRAAGYANASWNGTAADVAADDGQVRLFLVAESGPLFRFGELVVNGLELHDLETVQNLAGFPVGTPVSDSLLLDYQERLQKSGLFEHVVVALDPDPASADAARIVVQLREAPIQVYTFALGVSANTGPRASVEHVYRRVFGYAATARNKVEWGRLRQAWDGEISTHPGDHMYRNLLGGAVEQLESSTDVVLSQRLRAGRARDTQRVDRLYFVEAERSKRTTDTSSSSTLALSLNAQGLWRQLDSVLLPTEGYTLSLQAGVGRSNGDTSETGPFSRLYGRLTGYRPLGSSWYGMARVELGQVFKSDAVAVPDSQLFRAGGDESVRGYAYRSLGPVIDGAVSSGTSLFTGSFEMARPLSAAWPTLWGALFVDAGNATNGFGAMQPALGIGAGIRWRSAVGPLRLDWAWGRDVHQGRLHFSVGIPL
jgi:translocation and assembly module TamA